MHHDRLLQILISTIAIKQEHILLYRGRITYASVKSAFLLKRRIVIAAKPSTK